MSDVPMVFPLGSSVNSIPVLHTPALTSNSQCDTPLSTDRKRRVVKSAVASVTASGVLVTKQRCLVNWSTRQLSYPEPQREKIPIS